MYHVIDTPSGLSVSKYADVEAASKEVIKLDHKRKGYRHRVEKRFDKE